MIPGFCGNKGDSENMVADSEKRDHKRNVQCCFWTISVEKRCLREVEGKCPVDTGDLNLKFGQRSGKPPSMAMDFVDPHFGNYLHGGGTRSHNNK